jgi:hypothetical protein
LEAFKTRYLENSGIAFENDIRCVAHIINIMVQTILKDYISNTEEEYSLQRYVNIILPILSVENTFEIEEGSTFNSKLFYYFIN